VAGATSKGGADHYSDSGSLRPLSAEDLSILALETEIVAGHTCKVIVLDDRIDVGRLRASIAGRLDRAPALRMRLGDADGEPCWELDPDLNMDAHVALAEEQGPIDMDRLRSLTASLFEQRLDRSRPLWRIDVVPVVEGAGSALIWRLHHAVADGHTSLRVAWEALLDEGLASPPPEPGHHGAAKPVVGESSVGEPSVGKSSVGEPTVGKPTVGKPTVDKPTVDKPTVDKPGVGKSSAADLSQAVGGPGTLAAAESHHRLAHLSAIVRETPHPFHRSPFSGRIDAQREIAFAATPLDAIRRAARAAHGATVNDAVLTVVAGGLRRWLESEHGRLGSLRIKVPVSLHNPAAHEESSPAAQAGNRDSFFCLDVPLGPEDPLVRMRAVNRATRSRKEGHDAQQIDVLMRRLEHAPQLRAFAERVLAHPRSFALNVSNVRGPMHPVHVLGASVRSLYSLAEIREHHALRVAVASLAGTLSFGLTADPTLLTGVDRLAKEIELEAAELVARVQQA
jgi:diacylglycerol O-acyltransferase / wax synthase